MDLEEYCEFLKQFWQIFGPPPPKEDHDYKNVKL